MEREEEAVKWAIMIVALVALIACGNSTPWDLSTAAGYHQGVVANSERVIAAVNTAYATCATGKVDQCGEVLRAQKAVYAKTPELSALGGARQFVTI